MRSVLLKIKAMYNEMGYAERKIADIITDNPNCIIPLKISDFAEISGCGTATVVRFAKRLGLNGYGGLKLAIASEISSLSDENRQVSKNDSCYEIFTKRIRDIRIALENTASVLDASALETAAQKIINAKRIIIFGLGNSASVVKDAEHKFLRVGLDAVSCSDNHLQAIIASHTDAGCVVIGVTHSGLSNDIIEALKLAKINNAFTVCVTNYANTPICEVSDIKLFTKSDETEHSLLAMSSRIAQLTIFDAIYTYIVAHSDKKAINAIYNTETALADKKIH